MMFRFDGKHSVLAGDKVSCLEMGTYTNIVVLKDEV